MNRAALFACVLATSSAQAGELVLWHSYRAGEAEAVAATARAFEAAHPETTVRVLEVPFGAYLQKLRAAIPEGQGPDLFIASHDQLGDLAARALAVPIPVEHARAVDPSLADFDRYLPATVAPLTERGSRWGWPLAFKTLVLFYRTDLMPTPPATVAELEQTGRALKSRDIFGLAYEAGSFYFHAPWFFGLGGRLFEDDGRVASLVQPAALISGALLHRWLVEEKLAPADADGALVTELFNRGRAAAVVSGPWLVSEIATSVPYAVAPLPHLDAEHPARPFATIDGLFLTPSGAKRDETFQLAAALVGLESSRERATRGRQPVALASAYDDAKIGADPLLRALRDSLGASLPMPTRPEMTTLWEPLAEALRAIARDADTPARAFANADAKVQRLLVGLPEAVEPAPYVLATLVLLALMLAWSVRRAPAGTVRAVRSSGHAYAFIAPAALGMALLVGLPFITGMGLGFFAHGPGETRFVGFANFVDIALGKSTGLGSAQSFYARLVVTVLWTFLNVAFHVGVGLTLALLLTPAWVRGRAVFRVLLILPWAIPSYITALVFKGLFNQQLGAVNALLNALGLEPVAWFDRFWPAFAANVTTNVWLGFPFMMVTILGILQSIPQDLYEAARVDGANRWQELRYVTLPYLLPALVPAVVLGTIWTFNMFNVVFLVSEGRPEGATDILVTEAYRWAFGRQGNYGYAAAYSVLIFAVLLGYQTFTRRVTGALSARST